MKGSSLLAVSAVSVSVVSAIQLAPKSANPRVINLDIERRIVPDVLAHDRSRMIKRSKTVSENLENEETLYYANITLGTPSQSLRLHIDTGSSDLWVNVANSTLCRTTTCAGGTYNSADSSTYKFVNDNFNISYVDGSSAIGDYVSDTLGFGGVTLDDFQFGLGESSTSYQGVLGIGYQENEVQVQRARGSAYPNLPAALVNGDYINRNAYSLWLNDLDSSTGSILFGGVNTAKYTGELETVPILQEYGEYVQLLIALSDFGVNGSSLDSSSLPAAVLLDSGSTLSYLPNDITDSLYKSLGAYYDSTAGAAYAYCDLQNENATLDYTFSGKTIKVPFNELFLDAGTNSQGEPLTFQNGKTACIFGVAPTEGTTAVLGDTFLRSAYVVYDLANNEISLAQTVFNATADDIQEIASGTTAVPGATPAPSTVTNLVAATGTGAARIGGVTATATVIGAGPGNTASPKNALYIAGAAVMAGAGLLI